MENSEIRHFLEKEILRLKACNKRLTSTEFTKYYACLSSLCQLDRISAIVQDKIYTATYGSISDFVTEFARFTSPLLDRKGKKISTKAVLSTNTDTLFSSRLIEIALGCMISIFLKNDVQTSLSVFAQKDNILICASGNSVLKSNLSLDCIKKITALHHGRCMLGFCSDFNEITLSIPRLPQFQPLKLVPCAPELCRLCNI